MSKFCMYCGQVLHDEAAFCTSCGKSQIKNVSKPTAQPSVKNNYPSQNNPYINNPAPSVPTDNYQRNYSKQTVHTPPDPKVVQKVQQENKDNELIYKLSQKVTTEAIVWLVVASIQTVMAFIYFISGVSAYEGPSRYDYFRPDPDNTDATICIVTGIILIIVAIINFRFASSNFRYAKEVKIRPTGIILRYQSISTLVGTLIYNLLFGGIVGVIGTIMGFCTRNFVMSNIARFRDIEERNKHTFNRISLDQWKCSKCGKVHDNSVVNCSCGNTKAQSINR